MPVTEGSRDRMHQRLKQVLGDEEATTLMEHLPPKGWDEVATKHDVAVLRKDVDGLREWVELKLAALSSDLRADIANLRGEMHNTLRTHTLAVIGAMTAVNGIMVALVR